MKRFVLFFITNMAVIFLFSIVMLFMNVQFFNLINLLIISGIIGFFGSIISLLMSKYIALISVNGRFLKEGNSKIEDWLLQTIRNQSKKLGIITPQVAIYDASDMNAFATGSGRDSSLIAVSTGLLKGMTADEIEAVIAHELSHIFNGDMVTITLIQGIINTFVIFISRVLAYFVSYCVSFYSSSDILENRDIDSNSRIENGNSSFYFFIFVILELMFGMLANLVVLWFSRHREFYADAGSAKLVGYDKMIAALERLKLSAFPNRESSAVLCFCINGSYCKIGDFLSELFMSHPPLEQRIKVLRNRYYLD